MNGHFMHLCTVPPVSALIRLAIMACCMVILSACSSQAAVPFSYSIEPLSFEPGNAYNITDGRARFREIFCAANKDHGESLPDYMPCEEALVRFDNEPNPTGRPVDLGPSSSNLLGKMVPGLAYSCVKRWLHHDNSAHFTSCILWFGEQPFDFTTPFW